MRRKLGILLYVLAVACSVAALVSWIGFAASMTQAGSPPAYDLEPTLTAPGFDVFEFRLLRPIRFCVVVESRTGDVELHCDVMMGRAGD